MTVYINPKKTTCTQWNTMETHDHHSTNHSTKSQQVRVDPFETKGGMLRARFDEATPCTCSNFGPSVPSGGNSFLIRTEAILMSQSIAVEGATAARFASGCFMTRGSSVAGFFWLLGCTLPFCFRGLLDQEEPVAHIAGENVCPDS